MSYGDDDHYKPEILPDDEESEEEETVKDESNEQENIEQENIETYTTMQPSPVRLDVKPVSETPKDDDDLQEAEL